MADPDVIAIPANLFFSALGIVSLGVGKLVWHVVIEGSTNRRARNRVKDLAHILPRMRAQLERQAGIPSIMPPAEKPRKKMKTLTAIDKVVDEEERIESLLRRYVDPDAEPMSEEFLGFREDHDGYGDGDEHQRRDTEPPPRKRR